MTLYDYRCPKVCPGRSKTCHHTCERHAIYRELNEQRKRGVQNENLTITEAFKKKLAKTEERVR